MQLKTGRIGIVDRTKRVVHTEAGDTVTGYESHFATCPNASTHRKGKL